MVTVDDAPREMRIMCCFVRRIRFSNEECEHHPPIAIPPPDQFAR
jgi:hypothetical protein